MTEFRPAPTLSDAILVRHLDGCASPDEQAAVAAMDPLGHDAQRLRELGEGSERLLDVLGDLEVPETPAPRHAAPAGGRPALKAAGIALLLSAGAVVAMPAERAAVFEAVKSLVGSVRSNESAVALDGANVTVSVRVAASVFSLQIDHRQMRGVLRLVRSEGADVEILVPSDAEVVVLPGGVLIRNANVEGDVTVRVPASVSSMRVTIAGDEQSIVLAADDPSIAIDLGSLGR